MRFSTPESPNQALDRTAASHGSFNFTRLTAAVGQLDRWAAFHITHIMQQNEIAIPILPSRSLSDTLAFFRRLGFEGEIHSHGDYAIIRRGTVELHFFTHRELVPTESSAMCYIRVSDAEGVYRAFASAELPRRGIPRMDAIEDKPWGMREFAIVDSDGNLLRIGQTLRQ